MKITYKYTITVLKEGKKQWDEKKNNFQENIYDLKVGGSYKLNYYYQKGKWIRVKLE